MKIPLNKNRSSRLRYYLINEGMGGSGEDLNSPLHKYSIANGIDKGNGFQGYMSIKYALKCEYLTEEIKSNIKKELKKLGYII